MANIGQFKVGKEWQKIDDVTGYTYVADKSYTIQNKGYDALQLIIAPSKPETIETGFIIQQAEKVGYTCESGNYLWIRAYNKKTEINVAEGV